MMIEKPEAIAYHVREILTLLGEGNREGLAATPMRYAKALLELTTPEPFKFTTFSGDEYDEMIIQGPIPFYSLCEHHILPFHGSATVAYLPNGRIVGLSKLARCVKFYAAGLQNQERITTQIADRLEKELQPKGVAVLLNARHMCMEMRGVKSSGAGTITSAVRGVFRDNPAARGEFMSLRNLQAP